MLRRFRDWNEKYLIFKIKRKKINFVNGNSVMIALIIILSDIKLLKALKEKV